jgi:hypothetical protein
MPTSENRCGSSTLRKFSALRNGGEVGFRVYGGAGRRRAFSQKGYTPLGWSDGFMRALKREAPLEIA